MSNNIKVAIRVRPLISREEKQKLTKQWEVNENSIYPIDTQTGKRNGDTYNFDHIFDSTCSNIDIYNTVVEPVVEKAVNGFNGSVFAYGQTSSGKTHTMMGHADEPGLISLAVQNIFQAIEQSENKKFLLRVSYMEIYNEKMYDLLDTKNSVKIYEDVGGFVNVTLKEEVTDSADKMHSLMKKGDKARKIGETNMNEKSSRSHTIFRIIIESSDLDSDGIVTVAHLNLVDLAGSERAFLTKATGMRLKEGAHINKSLSTLSLVMKQLSESQEFINFRDSKLTRILQPSLGGNALTAIICAVTPVALEETHSTLAFASRAKKVKNKPQLNELLDDKALINRYALEIGKLRNELEKANDTKDITVQKNMELEEKIVLLEKCIIYPSRSHSYKKNGSSLRRRTWCAPGRPQSNLSIIFENDLLQNPDKIDNCFTKIEEFDLKDQPEKLSCEIKSARSFDVAEVKSPDNSRNSCSSDLTQPSSKQSEDLTSWFTSLTDTPKSELRKRAEYFKEEYDSLRELTRMEKLVLDEDPEINNLKERLTKAEHDLEMERKSQAEFLEIKKKNIELTKKIKELTAAEKVKTDYEFVIEMHKEKTRKREQELLDRLKEITEELSKFNSEDLTPQLKIPPEVESLLENFKLNINSFQCEILSGKPIFILQEKLSSIKEFLIKSCENSLDFENLIDFMELFRQIFELISILFSNDSLIQDLNEEKNKLSNKFSNLKQSNEGENKCVQTEEHFSDLLSKDKEIEALSDKIMEYIEEISSLENQLEKIKKNNSSEERDSEIQQLTYKNAFYVEKISKLEEEIKVWTEKSQNQISKSLHDENLKELIQIKDEIELKNQTIIDLENNFRLKIEENEKLNAIISEMIENEKRLKNTEKQKNCIINNYISKISDYDKELNKCKNELQTQTKMNNENNNEIKNLMTKISEYAAQINKNGQELNKLKSELETKTNDIQILMSNLSDYESTVNKMKKDFSNEMQNLTDAKDSEAQSAIKIISEDLQRTKSDLQQIQILFNSKESEIQNLISEISLKDEKLSEKDKIIIQLQETVSKTNVFTQTENLELVTSVENMKILSEDLQKAKSDLLKIQILLSSRDSKIQNLISEISLKDEKLSEKDKFIVQLQETVSKTNVFTQTENLESTNSEDNKNTKILSEDLQRTKLELQQIQILLDSNKTEIDNLISQISLKDDKLSEKDKIIMQLQETVSKSNVFTQTENLEPTNSIDNKNTKILSKDLQSTKSNLRQKHILLDSKDSEIEYLISKISLKDEKLSEKDKIITQLKKTISKTNTLTQTENLEFNNSMENMKILSEDLQKTKSDLQQIQFLLNSKESEIKNLSTEICLKDKKISEKDKIIIQLQETVSKSNVSTQSENLEHTSIKNEFVKTKNKLFETEAKLEKLKNNFAESEKRYENEIKKITQIANSKLTNMKSKYELMQAEITYKDTKYQELNNKFTSIQSQIYQKNNDNLSLQKSIIELKAQNENIQKILEECQERSYSNIHNLKKKMDVLKQENLELKKSNSLLNNSTTETQELFASAKNSLELLQKENDNYVSNIRSLEECVENLKYELHEIKNKSKENIRKVRRQSLHDSSRNLSSNENTDDVSKLIHNKENELQIENKKLQKKIEQLISLCKLRKLKIEELEKKIQNTN